MLAEFAGSLSGTFQPHGLAGLREWPSGLSTPGSSSGWSGECLGTSSDGRRNILVRPPVDLLGGRLSGVGASCRTFWGIIGGVVSDGYLRDSVIDALGGDAVPVDGLRSRLGAPWDRPRGGRDELDRLLQLDTSFTEVSDGFVFMPALLEGTAWTVWIDSVDGADGFVRMHRLVGVGLALGLRLHNAQRTSYPRARIVFSLEQNLNGRRRRQVTSHEAQSTVAEGRNGTEGTVTILLDRKQASVSRVEGETLLESARRAGLSPPFSCEAGNCGTCMARLTDGRATMRVNDALDEDEVADGYILTCQAVPDTPSVSVEYE